MVVASFRVLLGLLPALDLPERNLWVKRSESRVQEDGSVVTWGSGYDGGDSSALVWLASIGIWSFHAHSGVFVGSIQDRCQEAMPVG